MSPVYTSRRRRRYRQRRLLLVGLFLIVLIPALLGFMRLTDPSPQPAQAKSVNLTRVSTPTTGSIQAPESKDYPDAIKGIYLTAPTAASPYLGEYLDLLDRTELNAVVIDVKDVTGEVYYPSQVPLAKDIGATRDTLTDLKSLVAKLKKHHVYAIARVATFEDDILPRERPDLAVTDSSTGGPWTNYASGAWSSVYQKEVWKYNVDVAKEAADAGFDEVQFDYVRFPSDGPMETIDYGKETFPTQADALAGFLKYAHDELKPRGVRVAADVFGLAATEDGAGVGQYIDKLAPNLDVICPMVYPSHFPPGSYGYTDPNSKPYEIIKNALADFKKKTAANPDIEIRPWLQDFDLGTPHYGPDEVKAQMKSTYDSGETGWFLWNAGNVYTDGALQPEDAAGKD